MTKPRIAIIPTPSRLEEKYNVLYVTENYRQAIIDHGGNPFLLLPPQSIDYVSIPCRETPDLTEEELNMLVSLLQMCDGIVLPGGNKIFYYEYFIIHYAMSHNIPILGTCLGMQAMASCNKEENIIVRIEEGKINHCQPMVDEVHKVVLKENSKLANILNTKELNVNSVHSFYVEGTGPYEVAGYSEDGIIEAIEYKENDFNIGVQWHPERIYKTNSSAERLWKVFLESAKKYQKEHQIQKKEQI